MRCRPQSARCSSYGHQHSKGVANHPDDYGTGSTQNEAPRYCSLGFAATGVPDESFCQRAGRSHDRILPDVNAPPLPHVHPANFIRIRQAEVYETPEMVCRPDHGSVGMTRETAELLGTGRDNRPN